MSRFNGNRTPSSTQDTTTADAGATGERRRLGRIVHDDRGTASVEWRDAPGGHDRPVFRVEGTGVREPLSIRNDDTFDPYDRTPDANGVKPPKGGKRDLRKLSAWLQMMREIEERKKRGED